MKHILTLLTALLFAPLAALHAADAPAKKPKVSAVGHTLPEQAPVFSPSSASAGTEKFDLVIYGGTSAGIAAAVQAKRLGLSTVVIEPGRRIGGLTTGGLGETDIGGHADDAVKKTSYIGGVSREFYRDVATHYRNDANWSRETPKEIAAFRRRRKIEEGSTVMWSFEPSVALAIYQRWVKANDIPVVYGERLMREGEGRTVRRENGWHVAEPGSISKGVEMESSRIKALIMESGKRFEGRYFMDATYEGDLMAGAGVSFTIGREGFDVYGENLNGVQARQTRGHQLAVGIDPYIQPGDPQSGLLPGIDPDGPGEDGSSDHRIQAFNFRMCLTDHPENRIPFHKPEGYREIDFELLLRNFEAGAEHHPLWPACNMPNRKSDTNNRGGFSSDLIGSNYNWPEGSYAERDAIYQRHLLHHQGLMWTLSNHPRVPEAARKRVSQFGMTKDEFVEGNGWQDQLYVREARRMVSDYVMVQHHCEGKRMAEDAVGMAAYTMDSHNTQRYITSQGFVRNEGNIEYPVKTPFPISYRSIIPRKAECVNLSVPVALSASHIAFGSIRMEPVFMILGQSAATASALALETGEASALQDVDYPALRKRLLADGQVLAVPAAEPDTQAAK